MQIKFGLGLANLHRMKLNDALIAFHAGLNSRAIELSLVQASADCAEEMKDITGVSPWRLHFSVGIFVAPWLLLS